MTTRTTTPGQATVVDPTSRLRPRMRPPWFDRPESKETTCTSRLAG